MPDARDDLTTDDLAAGGALPPTVGVPPRRPRKPRRTTAPRIVAPANARGEGVSAAEVRPIEFRAIRVDPDKGIVYGVAYPAWDPEPGATYDLAALDGRVDSWGTFMRARTVEALAHAYLAECSRVDEMHDQVPGAGVPVESHIARGPAAEAVAVPDGSWLLGVRVADEALPAVRSGKLTGFSIDVYARRKPCAVRVRGTGDAPDLNGVTEPPFFPKTTRVDGEAELRLDELLDPTPNFVSIVDRPATGYAFEARRAPGPRGEIRFHVDGAPDVVLRAPGSPAASDDHAPATRGWLRALLAPVLRALGRDPAAALADGTPPPAPQEDPVPTPTPAPAETRSRIARAMGGPLDFATEMQAHEIAEETWEASMCLYDVISSIICTPQAFSSPQAMLEELARQMNAYLAHLAEAFSDGEMDDAAESRAAIVRHAVACLAALPGVEQRAGRKYSDTTANAILAAYDAIKALADDVRAEQEKAKPKTDDGAMGTIAPIACAEPNPLEEALAAARAEIAALAEQRAAVEKAATETAASARAEADAATQRAAALEGQIAEMRAAAEKDATEAAAKLAAVESALAVECGRVAELEARRAPSGQVGSDASLTGPAQSSPAFEQRWLSEALPEHLRRRVQRSG